MSCHSIMTTILPIIVVIIVIIGIWPSLYSNVALIQLDRVTTTSATANSERSGLAPEILMVYNGTSHHGELIDYSWESGDIFSNPDIPPQNLTTNLSNLSVMVVRNSTVEFIVNNNNNNTSHALDDKPNSIAVTAYSIEGKPVKVLNATEESSSSTFTVSLDEGKYVLLVVATWLPDNNQDISEYVWYNYRVKIIN